MTSTSWARRGDPSAAPYDDRSAGGKIVRGRRNPRSTPYDRPSPATAQRPNWLTGVVLPKIATGAASFLSSFISSPEDSDDSFSSSEEDDNRDGSPADGSDESTHSRDYVDGVDMLNKEDVNTPEFDKYPRKELQLTTGKSETKSLIEKLVMQETFSREERDNLMGIINSRVIDGSSRNEGLVPRSDIPDLCAKAIVEAKQWLEEKKELSSQLQLAQGISTPNTVMLPHDTKGGLSSPVDLAKAYMQNRPPWSSPLLNSVVEKTPSRVGLDVLIDEVPHGSSFSSSKHKLSSGQWSINDEIRRVRSKATEDMLKTDSSQKNNLFSFSVEPEGTENTLPNGTMDASLNLTAAGVNTSYGLPATAVDTAQNDIQMVEEKKCAADGSGGLANPEPISMDDLIFNDQNCPTSDGDIQLRDKSTDSGFVLSGSREVENNQHSDGKDPVAVSSSHDKLASHKNLEETCELLSETSVEIPGPDEVGDVAMDKSLSNSVKHTEESFKQLTRPKNQKQAVKGKSTKVIIGKDRKLRAKRRAT